jgi:hypothetical protein
VGQEWQEILASIFMKRQKIKRVRIFITLATRVCKLRFYAVKEASWDR